GRGRALGWHGGSARPPPRRPGVRQLRRRPHAERPAHLPAPEGSVRRAGVKSIIICGVGALGSTAAVLCRNLELTLVFVDFDRVESKNLLAQAFVKQSVGKNKAEALKAQLLNFHGTKCEAFGVRLTADNVEQLCGGADLVVDCFDNLKSRAVLSDFARLKGKALVHAAISGDGTFGIVRWDE